MKMQKRINYLTLIGLLFSSHLLANNLEITNLNIANINELSQYAEVEMDISWENSWRDGANWDAVWIFIKYREVGDSGPWLHAGLNFVDGTNDGHTPPSGGTINTPFDGKGVFLYRSGGGSGTINFTDLRLRWNFGSNGLSTTDQVDIQAFAIEMVYVPQGAFWVGDGQTTPAEIYGNFEAGTTGNAFQVSSENGITLGGGAAGSLGNNDGTQMFDFPGCSGCLSGSGDDFNDVSTQALPGGFPKGYTAFYCMKYELTQEQFVDMINCSTALQQSLLVATGHFYVPSGSPADFRWGIGGGGGVYATTEPYVPLIYCDWIRAAAYADWAALRPMTELEFEKACRGPVAPVVDEYAWGNANIDLSDNLTINNMSQPDEGIVSGYDGGGVNGNAWVRAGAQSMLYLSRVGVFAANASNTGRATSGASIWGIMELSGHAWERAVSVGHTEGRKFTGLHGDGNLSTNGYANVSNWPGSFGGTDVDSNVGVGYRGGALEFPTPNLESNARVSSRRLNSGYWNTVIKDDGARFCRTAN